MSTEAVAAPLSPRQRDVLRLIQRVMAHDDRPPSVRYLAMRLGVHHSVIEEHLWALYRKGWLKSPTPEGIYCTHASR
jgi:DNA-binding transcriptional regulator YhcF (GntR family)